MEFIGNVWTLQRLVIAVTREVGAGTNLSDNPGGLNESMQH
jgi:hypothetical protein